MGKYQITHTCGHTEIINLFGKISDRDYQIAKAESSMCIACQASQIRADYNLIGTDKQVIWAYDIKNRFIQIFSKMDDIMVCNLTDKNQALYNKIKDTYNLIIANTSAKFWIDNKDNMSTESNVKIYIQSLIK